MKKEQQSPHKPRQRKPEPGELQMSETILAAERYALDLMEHRFRTILEAVDLPITLINSNYEYRWVNSCYAIAHGKKPSEFVGQRVPDVWGRETFDMHIKKNLDVCLGDHTVKEEAWVDFAGWGCRYCETVYSPYVSPIESYVIVVTYDMTERRKAVEALENSERRFRSLSEASLEAIVFMEDGVIVDANEALGRLFGYEGEDLRGRPATDFIVPELRNVSKEKVRTCAEGAYETMGLRKDGSVLPIEVNAREYTYEGKKLRISAVRDLTDRKKIEKQLKDYQDHLEKLVEERTAELKESEHNLKEANTALKVLLKHREEDRKELEEKFLANVQQLVLPHVEKLKKSALNPVQQMSINFIGSNLSDLISPFVKSIRDLNFTPRQLEVATLIRDGRTTKDIAGILNISKRAVDIQRFLIRKKLGLNKAKINLQAYLKSLS